jgi:hypothetical protein
MMMITRYHQRRTSARSRHRRFEANKEYTHFPPSAIQRHGFLRQLCTDAAVADRTMSTHTWVGNGFRHNDSRFQARSSLSSIIVRRLVLPCSSSGRHHNLAHAQLCMGIATRLVVSGERPDGYFLQFLDVCLVSPSQPEQVDPRAPHSPCWFQQITIQQHY